MRINKYQKGVALLSALLIMAICAILATAFLMDGRYLLNQANLVKGHDRLQAGLQGVQDWAIATVSTQQNLHQVRELQEKLNGVKIEGMIYALNGRFNLNSVQQWQNVSQFFILLRATNPDLTDQAARAIAQSLNQWLQYNTSNDHYYLQQNPPYRAAHQYMVSPSELRLVSGVTSQIYENLAPYITALPNNNYQVNVNYASPTLFMTLGSIGMDQAKSLVQCRGARDFQSVNDFMQQCGSEIKSYQGFLTVDNQYFLVVGHAKLDDQEEEMQTLLKVNSINNKPQVTIVWQAVNNE